ncbi:hypothetical protein ZIOFF_065140 [Zingiber officinale]|uniref:SKP1 component POZ domain-containing protein n=1 Tax=Zingiber officinale TaxID=94328 RepID=A0A8J5EWS4_ZINOF|nr:hypothetical protein ZIOFF_065140 [Zingiber officinale]
MGRAGPDCVEPKAYVEGMARMIMLRSSDNEVFGVVAMESHTIKHMIEDGCANNDTPFSNVSSKILTKMIEYCK